MAFDGIMIAAIVGELSAALVGSRIDKVSQPEPDEIVLTFRNKKLLLSANASVPRLHFTAAVRENPLTAPMFCMLLRKHIQGGRITAISQPDFERIVHFHIESFNEMGDLTQKLLIVEIMGKYSNIILVEGGSGLVLDSIKHVSYGQSSVRQILPGRTYVAAPSQNKRNPMLLTYADFLETCAASGELPAQKLIFQNYKGISPFAADLICNLADVEPKDTDADTERLYTAFAGIVEQIREGDFAPYALYGESLTPQGFSVICRSLYDDGFVRDFDSPSELVEHYFAAKANSTRIQQKSHDLRRHVQNLIERCVKKAQLHDNTLADAADRDELKTLGELITANIHTIQQGAKELVTTNYYDPEMPEITIPLDPTKTAAENAQSYFARYSKQKRAVAALSEQIAQNLEELQYLEGVREALNISHDEADLAQIREELAAEGFIKRPVQNKKQPRGGGPKAKPKPLHYVSTDGFDIFVGKNNAQNDELTLRFADQHDIWLHTRNIPGSHVILRCGNTTPSNTALEQAAMLAAYYSKARGGSLVPVDYCPRRQVKKPRGAKPGMVIYDGHQTAYVTPDEAVIAGLEANS